MWFLKEVECFPTVFLQSKQANEVAMDLDIYLTDSNQHFLILFVLLSIFKF